MEKEIRLERLRYPEVHEMMELGYNSVVFACGAVEQHGPHLPLFVDAEHGTELAVRIAIQMRYTLVAPTIRIGCSDHHMAFPGTISLRKSTFESIVSDYVASLSHHGFEYIMIIPSHGGNFGPLNDMLPRLRNINPGIKVNAFTDVVSVINGWKRQIESDYMMGDRVGGHADIAETAIMKYLHPDLVRDDLAVSGYTPEITDEVMSRIISEGFHTVTPNGIMGDARGATAHMGEQLIDHLVDQVVEFFQSE